MAKTELVCRFCGKECLPDQNVGWLTFPNGESHPVHLDHPGVQEEYRKQTKGTNE